MEVIRINEVQTQTLDTLTTEILILKRQTAQQIVCLGRAMLGPSATLKQIANMVGPELGITPTDALSLMAFAVHGGEQSG